jgi:hypothetical protein
MTKSAHIVLVLGIAAAAVPAHAQTATVSALTGQSCAGTRSARNLNCTSNDFTTTATFTQPSASQIASCIAGSTLSLNVISTITSSSPNRYNAGVFLGENGNDPALNNAAATCSLGVFPLTPAPFQNSDGNSCGDFASGGTATLQVNAVSMKCLPAPGTNVLNLPYTLVFDNQTGNATSCNASIITAATSAKCVSNSAAQVTQVGGAPVVVEGWVQITKQTVPSADPQSFAFTATAAATPASFSLTAGQTQVVRIPLSGTGGSQTLQIDETALTGWVPTAAISCTSPSGGSSASYVTIDNANRRISAVLTPSNYGAICTITNTKYATVTISESSVNGTGAFSYGGGINGLPASLTLDTSTTNPASSSAYVVTANNTATAITQTIPAGWTLSAGCTDGSSSFGSLSGGTLTIAAANVVAGRTIICTFTDTRLLPQIALVHTADSPTKIPGATVIYAVQATNSGPGSGTNVVLSENMSRYTSFSLNAFGAGAPFQFTDGAPSSGLSLGTPVYSSDGGATYTYTPVSGGGGAPAGYDGNVTNWKIPMTGTMPANGTCSVSFKAIVN